MIANLLEKIPEYVSAGADMLTVHVESCLHAHRALQMMRDMTNVTNANRGIVRGIALNPGPRFRASKSFWMKLTLCFWLR